MSSSERGRINSQKHHQQSSSIHPNFKSFFPLNKNCSWSCRLHRCLKTYFHPLCFRPTWANCWRSMKSHVVIACLGYVLLTSALSVSGYVYISSVMPECDSVLISVFGICLCIFIYWLIIFKERMVQTHPDTPLATDLLQCKSPNDLPICIIICCSKFFMWKDSLSCSTRHQNS